MLRRSVLLLAVALFAAPPAGAQGSGQTEESAPGYVNAFACGTLPQPLSIHVEVMDNSDENLKLKGLLEKRLRGKGVTLNDSAKLVLSLEVAVSRQATRLKAGDMVDVRVGRDEPNLGQEGFARVHMNIWSSSRDSLLTGRQTTVEEEGFDILRLRASLNSREDGRCLWQGEVVHDLGGEAPYRFAPKLIPVLADAMGKSLSRKPISAN